MQCPLVFPHLERFFDPVLGTGCNKRVHDGIYFIPTRGTAKGSSIQFFIFATGKIKTIATMEKPAGIGLTVSPDGRWMLYTQVDQSGSDLMLVENFR